MSSESDPVLQLGRDLADSLDPSDVVGRWMSHHLADLIRRCEASPQDAELAATTRGVVLAIWERKRGARFKTEPYGYLQAVLRAVARLDPAPAPWAHYRPFDGQEPTAEALTTHPLLYAACEADREVGRLIRLAVAVAAREAMSLEEPWVTAGMDLADTEEDRALRAIERLARRSFVQSRRDVGEMPPLDHQGRSTDDSVQPAFPAVSGADTNASGGIPDSDSELGPADPLMVALGAAVYRCRALIDQMAALHGERSSTEVGKSADQAGATPAEEGF